MVSFIATDALPGTVLIFSIRLLYLYLIKSLLYAKWSQIEGMKSLGAPAPLPIVPLVTLVLTCPFLLIPTVWPDCRTTVPRIVE